MLRGNFPVLVYPEDSSTSREWSKTAPPMRIKMQVGAGFDVPKNWLQIFEVHERKWNPIFLPLSNKKFSMVKGNVSKVCMFSLKYF